LCPRLEKGTMHQPELQIEDSGAVGRAVV
jgi:hypothetical protein